jgi:hypothetical protein
MKIKAVSVAGILVLAALASAQEKSSTTTPPPKVLVITREFVKPGRTGTTHEKSESAFVQAMSSAKWPTHYLAVDSITGKPRSLFFTGFDNFEAWEKDALATQKNSALSAALEKAGYADGDLLSEVDGATFAYREDFSLRPNADIPHMRYFEISRFQVKPGHDKEFEKLVKMVMAAYEKIPDVQWACYQAAYGSRDGTYLFFSPHKSAVELDHLFAQNKQFDAAMGEDGMKQLGELMSASVQESETNLFAFNPRMSYVSDEWIKADAEFWTTKSAIATTHKKKTTTEAAKQ